MFQPSGLLKSISCPFGADCHRPHCHFRHETATQPIQQPDYAMTTYAPQTVICQEEQDSSMDFGGGGYFGYVASQGNQVYGQQPSTSSYQTLPHQTPNYGFGQNQPSHMLHQQQPSIYAPEDPTTYPISCTTDAVKAIVYGQKAAPENPPPAKSSYPQQQRPVKQTDRANYLKQQRSREQFSPITEEVKQKSQRKTSNTGVPVYIPTPINRSGAATKDQRGIKVQEVSRPGAPAPSRNGPKFARNVDVIELEKAEEDKEAIDDILSAASHVSALPPTTSSLSSGPRKRVQSVQKRNQLSSKFSRSVSTAIPPKHRDVAGIVAVKDTHSTQRHPGPREHLPNPTKPINKRDVFEEDKVWPMFKSTPPTDFIKPKKRKEGYQPDSSVEYVSTQPAKRSTWIDPESSDDSLSVEEVEERPKAFRGVSKSSSNSRDSRPGSLNANIKAIAEVDQWIAEKERDISKDTSLNSSLPKKKSPVWRATQSHSSKMGHRSGEPWKIPKQTGQTQSTFDINSLFDDDDFVVEAPQVEQKKTATRSPPPDLVIDLTKPEPIVRQSTNFASNRPKKVPSANEQMRRRFATATTSSGSMGNQERPLEAGFGKGEKRKARTLTTTTSATGRSLTPLDAHSSRMTFPMRMKYLQMLYDEFQKIATCDRDEAVDSAVEEEKAISDKATTKPGYIVAIANAVQRIRKAAVSLKPNSSSLKVQQVSHNDVLAGRHLGTFSVGLHGRRGSIHRSNNHISEADFYSALRLEYLMSKEQLYENGYPIWVDSQSKGLVAIKPSDDLSRRQRYVPDEMLKRVCARCGVEYRLTKDGGYLAEENTCIFHWGKAWKRRVNGAVESRYNCCDQDLSIKGCTIVDHHITDTLRQSTLRQFVETPRPVGAGDPRSGKVYAMDCEMVYGVWGMTLARISIVDVLDELVLDEMVRPEAENPVVDCNTRFSGLTKEQIEKATYNLAGIHDRFFELVNSETILIGHSLESDLKAMKVVHGKVVDTSVVFPHRLGPPKKRALKNLTTEYLQKIIQEDETGHDSKEDASACMKLMLYKVRAAT